MAGGDNSDRPRIATLKDTRGSEPDGDDGSDDESQPQTFFTGGAKSGMAVQNPDASPAGDGNGGPADLVRSIIGQAKASRRDPSTGDRSGPAHFVGAGYKLGSDEVPSEVIMPPSGDSSGSPPTSTPHTLNFWRNGFTVDDGPLLSYDDPANADILKSIHEGKVPRSLFDIKPGELADVHLAHHMNEDFKAPPATLKPFAGTGQRLGSHVPSAAVHKENPTGEPGSSAMHSAHSMPSVDESKPITTIQLRLANGTKVVVRFNQHQLVGDIYNYVNTAHPTGQPYILQTNFPTKPLQDKSQTLKDASLITSVVVVQRLL